MRYPTKASLDDALGWVRSGKIAPGAELTQAGRENDEAFDLKARLFQRVFETKDGREVLELLLDVTVRKEPVDYTLPAGSYEAYAQLRQGQNQIAALILDYLNRAAELDATENDRRDHRGPGRADPARLDLRPSRSPAGWSGAAFGDGDDGDAAGGYDDDDDHDPNGDISLG
jgi:hypothetical protein